MQTFKTYIFGMQNPGLPDGIFHIFEPKIPTWVNFGGSTNGRCWSILLPFDILCNHLVYFMVI
jgi:hypothetical protein